jgi:RNA polymerase sigma factor (sigma-70 family)
MNDMLRLIEPLIPSLRRYARALVKDRATADDLVQDCLERAVSRWYQRRNDRDARSWMFAILHNLAVSHFRGAKVRGPHVSLSEVPESALGNSPAQEQQLFYKDVLESVRRLQVGLHSFLSMRRIEARRKNASAFRLRFSQSLASLRQRLSQAMVRSTIQRLGKTANPLT